MTTREERGEPERTKVLRGVEGRSVKFAEERLRMKGHRGSDTAESQRLHADPHVPVWNQRCKGTTWVTFKAASTSFPKTHTGPARAAAHRPLPPPTSQRNDALTQLTPWAALTRHKTDL